MNRLNHIIAGAMILGFAASVSAKPALRELRTVTQPDGSQLQVKVIGDERQHFTILPDGTLLHEDEDGFYRLGKIADDGAIVSTGLNIADKTMGVKLTDVLIQDIQSKRMKSEAGRRRAPQSGLGLYSNSFPATGNTKGLIILVEYSDVKFRTSYNAESYFREMINGDNFTQFGGTGSALKYFTDQSGGKFTPSFDIYGPVTLPNTQSYYGKNDRYGSDANAHLMVTDAMDILDSRVDFSQYDTDNDGYIDNVYVFYAGQGEADYGSANTVWPHSWELLTAGVRKKYDGVTANRYACSNEWEQYTPAGVGTFVHEFSHVMGLPDLYHTSSNVDYTPGTYSVLDYGPYNNDGRTPPNYGAYEKNAMGWYEPIMLNDAVTVSLHSIDSGEFGLTPTDKTNEFFLFENRQQEGWDKYIPNHGMLIWHIDYNKEIFVANTVNNNKSHQYVDIVEANNNPGTYTEKGYTFPGTTGKTSFTSQTSPAFKSWSGKGIDYPITDIAENDGVITFDVAGGDVRMATPEPRVSTFSEYEGYFVASWDEVEGATDYFVSVYGGVSDTSGTVSTGFNNSKLSAGWEASATDWYTTSSNFGEASPSYKFGKNGQTLTSEETDGDITKIEFWAKGQSSDGTYLIIDGFVDGAWVKICEYTPLKNKSEIKIIDSGIPSGVRKVRFTMSKATGNIAIDDIVITYGGGAMLLPDYDNVSTQGRTSFKADRLLTGVKEYYFTVTASDGNKTRTSAPVFLKLEGESGTTSMSGLRDGGDVKPEYFNLQGIRILNPTRGTVLIERKGSETRKIIF